MLIKYNFRSTVQCWICFYLVQSLIIVFIVYNNMKKTMDVFHILHLVNFLGVNKSILNMF